MYVEVDVDEVKTTASQLNSLADGIKASDLDGRVKIFFIRVLDALKFSLDNMEIFGFDSAWVESANLVGGALRFRNELASNPDLRQKVAATAWQVMQFLADVAGGKEGGARIGDAARELLGAAPTIRAEV